MVFDHPKTGDRFSFGPRDPQDRWPAVLLVHGFKGYSTQRHLQGISDALVDKGFLTVRADLTKNPGRSYQEFADMTYGQELADCEDVLDYLLALDLADKSSIGIAGHSLAGMLTAELSSKRKEIKALAILSGVYSFEFVAKHIFGKPYQKAKKEFNQKGWTSVWSKTLEKRLKINRAFWEDIAARNADNFAKDIMCPTLVVSSGRDEAVAQMHADSWMKNLGTSDKKMEIVKGSDHDYSGDYLNKVTGIVSKWFEGKINLKTQSF